MFSRTTTQIWAMDANPNNNDLVQVLENIGTVAPLSVKSIGDLDVYFLADSGFRSVRVRDASSNALIADVGTPIDTLIQGVLAGMTDANKAVAAGVVDPSSNRYWCCVNGVIYVYSNFQESGIKAWSTYTPTFRYILYPSALTYPDAGAGVSGPLGFLFLVVGRTYTWIPSATDVTYGGLLYLTAQTSFTPTKFELLNGRIYVRAGDDIFLYGGTSGVVYDDSVASWATFWMDAKSPSTRKESSGIDAAFTGAWTLSFGMDASSGIMDTVYVNNAATYWQGRIPATLNGQHMKMAGSTTGETAATFDAFSILFTQGDTT